MLENITNDIRRYENRTTAADLAETACGLVEKYMADVADLYPRELRRQAMAILSARLGNSTARRGR